MPRVKYPRFIILGLLGIEPMTGYEIKKWVDFSFRYFWEIGYGQIYPTLKSLEEEGLVTMEKDHEEGGPERKIYSISPKGLDILNKWLNAPEEKEFEILLKLFFGEKLSSEILKEKVMAFRKLMQENYSAIQKVEQHIMSLPDTYLPKPYFKMVSSCGIFSYEAYLKWAEATLASIDEIHRKGLKHGSMKRGS